MTTEIAQRTAMQDIVARVRSDQMREQIALALPGNVSPERFQRVAVTAIQQNPDLITADRDSLFAAIVKCAQDGLLPDGREAAFVIFKVKGEVKAQYLPMIGGYRKIAAKHGFSIVADVVYANDFFEWSRVPPRLEHRPPALGSGVARGEIIGAYAVAFHADTNKVVGAPVVMDMTEIAKVRAVSKTEGSEHGPWKKWFERMASKTVARRLFKELPLGDLEEHEARIVQAADDEADLPGETGMSVEAANTVAPLTNVRPPLDDGPDDTPLEGDYEEPPLLDEHGNEITV